MKGIRSALALTIVLISPWLANGTENSAELRQTGAIAGVKWLTNAAEVSPKLESGKVSWIATLRGEFSRPEAGWSLVFDNKPLAESLAPKDGARAVPFELATPLKGELTRIEISAVGPSGDIESETIELRYAGWEDAQGETRSLKFSQLAFGLGPGVLTLNDSRGYQTTQLGLGAGASFTQLLFTHRIEANASIGGTLLPLVSSGSLKIRTLKLRLRGGYFPPILAMPWKLGVLGGFHFAGMYPSISSAGYKRISGPAAALALRNADSRHPISAEVGYASAAGAISLTSRELSFSVTWGLAKSENGSMLSLGAEASSTRLLLKGVTIASSSYAAIAQYEF